MRDLVIDLSRVALKRRRTKIVATVGPASNTPQMLAALIDAGVDVFRLNFSHGTHESHGQTHQAIRAAEARAGRHVGVLADLCGPKIRVGTFEHGGIDVADGAAVTVTVREVVGGPGLIPSEYPALARDLKPGDRVLLDDGKLELRVEFVQETEIGCRVITGGRLTDKKGMNLPGVAVSAPALTEKDRADALFAARLGVDHLALSFVRSADDVHELKSLLAASGLDIPVIAKIEKPEALNSIGAILEAADGIMVARGDLGVEMPAEQVPVIQAELVRLAILACRPVIVATQMLESMIQAPRPTRAEVADVADAPLALADAVMLSAETATGRYPREAVATMDRILRLVEGHQWKHGKHGLVSEHAPDVSIDAPAAMARAVALLSRDVAVRSIVVPTEHGNTARQIAAKRPAAPIVAVSADERVCRRLALHWGVTSELAPPERQADLPRLARDVVRRLGLAEPGQPILLVWDSDPAHTGAALSVSLLSA